MAVHNTSEAELAKVIETREDVARLQEHLQEILDGAAFKGSHRSGQFLKHILDQAMAGNVKALKERVIGVELFGRDPSYDTGEDAIVRVTASDVRKRLLQHYGKYGFRSEFEISLPLGSYIPKITRGRHDALSVTLPDGGGSRTPGEVPPANGPADVREGRPGSRPAWLRSHSGGILSLSIGILLASLTIAGWAILWSRAHPSKIAQTSVLPWSIFFRSPHPTLLITSDPDVADIQAITKQRISVSDYANHLYIPDPRAVSPEILGFLKGTLRGDRSAAVDTPIAAHVAALAARDGTGISIRGSRSIQLSDLATEGNLILLGSPLSNPWSALYSDELAFRFAWDKQSAQEIIENTHPRSGELARYIPTALGFATGQSFAIVAMVPNPHQGGQVLLLAGASAEGTEAAGKLATDIPWLSSTLNHCGINPHGSLRHFEILLRVSTMAGSPSRIDIEACRPL